MIWYRYTGTGSSRFIPVPFRSGPVPWDGTELSLHPGSSGPVHPGTGQQPGQTVPFRSGTGSFREETTALVSLDSPAASAKTSGSLASNPSAVTSIIKVMELWHACVVAAAEERKYTYLKADAASKEVYAQVSVILENQINSFVRKIPSGQGLVFPNMQSELIHGGRMYADLTTTCRGREVVTTSFDEMLLQYFLKREFYCTEFRPSSESLYISFHDKEWGNPVYDDTKRYELLALSQILAEMTWPAILNKRHIFRSSIKDHLLDLQKKLFDNFDSSCLANVNEKRLHSLRENGNSLLSEPKIRAIVENAKHFQKGKRNDKSKGNSKGKSTETSLPAMIQSLANIDAPDYFSRHLVSYIDVSELLPPSFDGERLADFKFLHML
ncbi:hypothetical protein KY284_033186 [Solanum tuberosum]|nr:hypothetical protein KY284_033186 [Solanum tuberosum]